MTITRYLNGKVISADDLYKMEITNPTLENICASVFQRIQKQRFEDYGGRYTLQHRTEDTFKGGNRE